MPYCTRLQAKQTLQIEETDYDEEISECITSADAFIDSILKHHGFSVPLSIVPQNVEDASRHFAAWLFRKRRDPAGAEVFYNEGKMFLKAYIDAEESGSDFRVVQA